MSHALWLESWKRRALPRLERIFLASILAGPDRDDQYRRSTIPSNFFIGKIEDALKRPQNCSMLAVARALDGPPIPTPTDQGP
jgi:hypothetical protein